MGRNAIALISCLAVFTLSCTFEIRDESVRWGCSTFVYEVNPEGAGVTQVEAVHAAVAAYTAVTGRPFEFVGETSERHHDGVRDIDDPVLIEWFWPEDDGQPSRFGFAEPHIDGGRYVGGFVYLHPMLGQADPDLVRRVAMHELGHIGGLEHVDAPDELMNPELVVDDFGPGDTVGLGLTHDRCGTGL